MSKDQVMENEEFLKYWLTHADANSVFEWLREQKPWFGSLSYTKEIEKVLIKRNEPVINLGLALYAIDLSYEASLSLFRNNDRTIKKAALSGGKLLALSFYWYEEQEVLGEILNAFDEELLKPLLSNESIRKSLLVSLYEREEPFNNLTDEQWLTAIAFTVYNNPLISTPLDELPWDGGAWVSYTEVFRAGWKLFETLPVNEKSACLLFDLGEKLVPCKPYDMDVFETIKRWKVKGDDESDGLGNSYVKCRYVLAKLVGSGSMGVKDGFGKGIGTEFESLKNSDDLALRLSYYRRFRAKKPEEIRNLFEKDNEEFLDVAIYNTNLYRNVDIREELRQCCCDFEDPYPELSCLKSFSDQVEKLTKEHPEWFPNFEGDIPFDEIEDPLLRVDKRLKILSQKLIGSDDQRSLIDDIRTVIEDVKSHQNESNQQLSDKLTMVINWGCLIGAVIIVLLLALVLQIS